MVRIAVCGVFFWVGLLPALVQGVETVRVDSSGGAPRLLVDGKPVRARMFWGAPGTRPVDVGPNGQAICFEFTPAIDAPASGTMHFRFGQIPGQIDLDNVRVVEVGTGRVVINADFESGEEALRSHWTVWPVGAANTVGRVGVQPGAGEGGSAGLRVTIQAPPGGQWPDFHLYHHANLELRKGRTYRVSLWARAKQARGLSIAFYRPGSSFTYLGGPPDVFGRQIKLAAAAGVQFVSFPCHLPWPEPGQGADFSASEAQCQAVLDANPQALLLPRIGVDAPSWWLEAHPDDAMQWDREPKRRRHAVVASAVYRREAALHLGALVAHLEAKFGPRIAGYHPCGQNTGEWFYEDTWGPALNGYSQADRQAWRAWLRARYRSDEALQAAWRQSRATLETAEVPSPETRRASPSGIFRDPVAERALVDFARFQQEAMADCVCQLAGAVRQASRGRKLVVFFYGYVFEFAAIQNGPATAGHYALRRVLECPDIDLLCSPISYFDRGLAESAPSMTAAESVSLAGKMWLYEDDTRTYLGTGDFPGWTDAVDTLEKTNRELVRNVGQCALRNFGTWWMDLGATGWFNDPRMWAEMARLKVLDEPLLADPRPFRPEVAAVIDEESMIHVAFGGVKVTRPGVYEVRRPLGRMGAPYGQYLLDDVTARRVQAKLYVMLTAWSLSETQRRQLRQATQGATRIWCYAPGYLDGDRASPQAMEHLAGFRMRAVKQPAWAEPTEVGKRLGLRQGFGAKQAIQPLFAAADATAEETLAVYADGSAAVALRSTADGPSLFVGPPGLTSELLRLAARRAGVHLFTTDDCNVYANGPYLVLHASQSGPLEIHTGRASPVRDLLGGQRLGTGPTLRLPLEKGETRVLEIGAATR